MKIDLQKLRGLESKKLISIQQHPTLPLLIHNYSPVCQYEKAWDEWTLMCRGLITDLEGNVIARPFQKFFNLSEHEEHQINQPAGYRLPPIDWRKSFNCTEKMDGSLGILYPTPDGHAIATRGSFTSDQAKKANEIFKEKGYDKHAYAKDLTYLFEIIYPENRIVVDYGDTEDLVLLEVIRNYDGSALDWQDVKIIAERIGCPVVSYAALSVDAIRRLEEYYGAERGNKDEGLVVRFSDGLRIKVKYEEYCRLHKLITGVNAKRIWESLRDGKSLAELLDRVPDEFYQWVTETKNSLERAYDDIHDECVGIFAKIYELSGENRKVFAEHAVKNQYAAILFAMLNKKDFRPIIWKLVKPLSSTPFKHDEH